MQNYLHEELLGTIVKALRILVKIHYKSWLNQFPESVADMPLLVPTISSNVSRSRNRVGARKSWISFCHYHMRDETNIHACVHVDRDALCSLLLLNSP